jgi:hypothetical protein
MMPMPLSRGKPTPGRESGLERARLVNAGGMLSVLDEDRRQPLRAQRSAHPMESQ